MSQPAEVGDGVMVWGIATGNIPRCVRLPVSDSETVIYIYYEYVASTL